MEGYEILTYLQSSTSNLLLCLGRPLQSIATQALLFCTLKSPSLHSLMSYKRRPCGLLQQLLFEKAKNESTGAGVIGVLFWSAPPLTPLRSIRPIWNADTFPIICLFALRQNDNEDVPAKNKWMQKSLVFNSQSRKALRRIYPRIFTRGYVSAVTLEQTVSKRKRPTLILWK